MCFWSDLNGKCLDIQVNIIRKDASTVISMPPMNRYTYYNVNGRLFFPLQHHRTETFILIIDSVRTKKSVAANKKKNKARRLMFSTSKIFTIFYVIVFLYTLYWGSVNEKGGWKFIGTATAIKVWITHRSQSFPLMRHVYHVDCQSW